MRAARVRELVDLPRSVGQEVGNAELGRDVDRLRDPIAPNESQKLLSGLERHLLASGHNQRSHVRPTTSIWPSKRAPPRSETRREGAFSGKMAEIAYGRRRTSRA